MRRPLVAVVLTAGLAASGCGSASVPTSGPYDPQPPPPQWHQPEEPVLPAPTPYPDVTFDDPGVNPFADPTEDHRSTFAMDVDTGSWTIARRYISDGYLPDPASVRVEEFVNAFDGGYAAPTNDTFAIHLDAGPTPFRRDPRTFLLRIGLRAADPGVEERPAAALTFVIDVSGSMELGGRLELVKRSLDILLDELRPDDTVGIVVYGTEARVVLPPTPVIEIDAIRGAIHRLHPEGSTNAEAGLRLGYQLARDALRPGAINRVVLASDGVANVGLTDADSILAEIRDRARAGIELVTVGVGMGNYNDALMEQLADGGDGFYAYVDDLSEARRIFSEELTGTLSSVALDAKVQVEFNRDSVEAYRLLGYENRAIADEDFRDDRVDAGAIGAGHQVTALYEIVLSRRPDDRIATVGLRWTDPGSGRHHETAADVRLTRLAGAFEEMPARFRLQATVAAYAEVLRGSPWARSLTLGEVASEAGRLRDLFPGDPEVEEFIGLVNAAARFDPYP